MFVSWNRFTTSLAAFDVALPVDTIKALDTLAAAETATAGAKAALAATADAGKLTPSNVRRYIADTATALAAENYGAEAVEQIRPAMNRAAKAAVVADVDRILDDLRPRFTRAAATVQEAGKLFAPGTDATAILEAGVEAARAHHALADALVELHQIRQIHAQLVDLANLPDLGVAYWITAADGTDQLADAERLYNGPDDVWHALAAAGFTLALNTAEQATQVRQRAEQVDAQRWDGMSHAQRRLATSQRSFGQRVAV